MTTLAVAGVVAVAAACGSEAPEPPDAPPGSEAPAPASAPVAPPEAATGSSVPPVGTPAPPEDPADTGAEAPQPAVTSIAPPPAPSASAEPRPQRDTSGMREFPAERVWEALRQCQSQGDYAFVHPSGQYFGAYQFTVATWDRLASQRYTHLLGVLPSEAGPADQDRMAYYLWIESGHARWPACSHVFTGDPPSAESSASEPDPGEPAAVAATDEEPVEGAPFEPAPADDELVPVSAPGAETVEPGEAGVTATTSAADLPALDIDPTMQPAIPPDVPGFPTEEQWEALRQCESSGNYEAFSRAGPYYGAYQFDQPTWDFVASRNYPRLVGVQPWHATPQDQTRMAYRLWEERGDQPWPNCGRHLRPGA